MCHRRISMGFSQKELGNHLGVNSQQIQKYETDLNRVSAVCLQEITKTLEVPVHFFTRIFQKKKIFPKKMLYTVIKTSTENKISTAKKNSPLLKILEN